MALPATFGTYFFFISSFFSIFNGLSLGPILMMILGPKRPRVYYAAGSASGRFLTTTLRGLLPTTLKRRIFLRRELSLWQPLLPGSSAVRPCRASGEAEPRSPRLHRLQPGTRLR